MMRYYKLTDADGKLTAIGTGDGGVEITAEEYMALSAEIAEKAALVAALADGRISAENIREDWREEIVRRAETEGDSIGYTEDELLAMTNAELERILATYGLTATANKSNMIRLILYMQQGGGTDA